MIQWNAQPIGLALGLVLSLASAPAVAQNPLPASPDATREANVDAYITLLRSDVRTEKVALIAQVMQFTEAEDAKFWPVYRDYEARLQKINDDRLLLTKEYATRYLDLDDPTADRLVKAALDLETRRHALTADYYDRLKAILPTKTAAKVLQVEHQLLLLLDLQIAASLPIVE